MKYFKSLTIFQLGYLIVAHLEFLQVYAPVLVCVHVCALTCTLNPSLMHVRQSLFYLTFSPVL